MLTISYLYLFLVTALLGSAVDARSRHTKRTTCFRSSTDNSTASAKDSISNGGITPFGDWPKLSNQNFQISKPSPKIISTPGLPDTYQSTLVPFAPDARDVFVTMKDGRLFLGEEDFTFHSFNFPPFMGSPDFELEDGLRSMLAFARPVLRCYTLFIARASGDSGGAFIRGWAGSDWEYNEDAFVMLDKAMDMARRYGVRIIFPVINNDYGSEDSNWVGNWADLIRMYYGLGSHINANVGSYEDTKSKNFWTDPEMIEATKKIYIKFLSRKNSVNGIVYGQDATFLAIETGNEMNDGGDKPPPGAWTVEIAKTIKSLAPNILVMDGSLARKRTSWAQEALEAPEVELFASHYYDSSGPDGGMDYHLVPDDAKEVTSHGKAFVVGEWGFFGAEADWTNFYKLCEENIVAGSLIWSLRPHSEKGGFNTHSEGKGIFSYHAPGWTENLPGDFDKKEQFVVRSAFDASYMAVGEPIPEWPIPPAPKILSGGSFAGAAWAEHYEVYRKSGDTWELFSDEVRDAVDPGAAKIPGGGGEIIMRGMSVDGKGGEWGQFEPVRREDTDE